MFGPGSVVKYLGPRAFGPVAAGLCLFAIWGGAARAQDVEWKDSYYNPQPAETDLILPMPCGGAMAFRRVDTPNPDGAIGDVTVVLGRQDEAQPFLDGVRRSFVSGPFSDGGGLAKGYFYMSKYELAAPQYDVVMQSTCPEKKPRKRDFVPSVDHSKLDYDLFAQRYTLWLMAENPDFLPMVGQTRAFLRLPSEDEWEYAARGGLTLDDALFRSPLPVLGEGEQISEYVAYGGADSASGKLQIIGTLKPNPIGLHDMLGNAAEIVETPFSMVRHGRLHGQVGGYVKRGGDARTPIGSLTLATRFEVPPYDTISGKPTADRYTGTRLVLSGLAITSPEQGEAMIAALDALAQPDPGTQAAATEQEALALLADLSDRATSARERGQIARIRAVLDAAQAERNTQRDRSIRLIMSSSVLVCDQAVQRYLNALAIGLLLPDYDLMERDALNSADPQLLQEVREQRQAALDQFNALDGKAMGNVIDYANFVEGLASEYSADLLQRQLDFMWPDMRQRSARRVSCMTLLEEHLDLRRREGFADPSVISGAFRDVAIEFAKQE